MKATEEKSFVILLAQLGEILRVDIGVRVVHRQILTIFEGIEK